MRMSTRRRSLLAIPVLGLMATTLLAAWWQESPPAECLAELPMDPAVALETWENADRWEAVDNPDLQRKVMRVVTTSCLATRASFEPPYEVTLRARWVNREAPCYGSSLYIGAANPDPRYGGTAYRVTLSPSARGAFYRMRVAVSRGSDLANRLVDRRPRRYDDRSATFMRRFESISPVWEPEFRSEVEAAMAQGDDPDTGWFRLRVVVGTQSVQFFHNGVCLGQYDHAERVAGRVVLESRDPDMHVAELAVRRFAPPSGDFQPIALEDRVNAVALGAKDGLALAPDALPAGGSRIAVGNVPFLLPHRDHGDHVDIGASLFHYRNSTLRFSMRTLWPAASIQDANRLVFTVPNRAYSRLWLLAASDEEPDSLPLITVRFYRPTAGFAVDAQADVPGITARAARDRKPLEVAGADGDARRLWLVPIELDANRIASTFREEPVLCIELTKQVFPYVPYPDPCHFTSFQGGPASAVRVFGATLEGAPVSLFAKGHRPASVFLLPELPVWEVTLRNWRDATLSGTLAVRATDPYGEALPETSLEVQLLPQETRTVRVPFRPEVLGLHTVTTTFTPTDGVPRAERTPIVYEGRFAQLPVENRRATTATSRWGLWCWHGGHATNPDPDENGYLIRASGSRGSGQTEYADRVRWGLVPRPSRLSARAPRWAFDDPDNMEARAEHAHAMGEVATKHLETHPDGGYLAYFLEDIGSMELMFGEYPKHLGKEGTNWTDEQKQQYDARFLAAKVGLEGVRKACPKAKISLGWTHPQFQIPLLRMGFPSELFDVIGIDFPTFMRMPEMPVRGIAPNRLWILKKEMDRLGYGDKPIVHHETYFPSSHPGALGEQLGADYTVRMAVLSLAMGSEKLAHCFSLHDCADYWGTQHYGASGLVGKRPEYIPKAAFPAYAVMTRLLDTVIPLGAVPTDSMSVYAVAFQNRNTLLPHTLVYCLWTLRGERQVRLAFDGEGAASRVDAQGNGRGLELTKGVVDLGLTPTPIWVTSTMPLTNLVSVGEPVYAEAPSGPTLPLGRVAEGWRYTAAPFASLEACNPVRAPCVTGPMKVETVAGRDGAPAARISLQPPSEERPMVDWYGVLEPEQPVAIPGRAKALGLWVNGNTSWGRVIYEITDARGERFLSTGDTENWNGDDSRQASYFNFDGWRYVEFPLPTHEPYDQYRGADTVWWGYDQEGVVDLPVKLTKVVVTHRTHHVYVNELVEIPCRQVDLGELVAVYADEADQTDAAVQAQQRPAYAPPAADLSRLPNPHHVLETTGTLPAPKIVRFAKPEAWYDGTQIMVEIEPLADVKQYTVYVSAHPDGSGASALANGTDPTLLVRRLRPEFPLYFFATYIQGRAESKPSPIQRLVLKDDFPNK